MFGHMEYKSSNFTQPKRRGIYSRIGLNKRLELHVLEANYYASKIAVENGHDVVDRHYFLRHQIHRRAEDCIHWDMTGHRRITKLVLTHIAQTWDIKLPKHIKMNIDIDSTNTSSSCDI